MGDRYYLDTDGAADHLGFTVRYIRHLVATRQIPHSKIGNRLVFDRRRLDEWIRSREVKAS